MKTIRVRFAPSPTGPLHIGGVRTALYNYLFARRHKGVFILRIEDTDQARLVPGAEKYIIDSLDWLGLTPDEGPVTGGDFGPYRQSERKDIYAEYAWRLVEEGKAYLAFDTPEEIDAMKRKMEEAGVVQPQYNAVMRGRMRNSLTLSKEEADSLINQGVPYVIRIKVPAKEDIRFHDEIRGTVVVHSSTMDDKVLLKSDGMPTYHLANIVDDHLMEITHVIRGEEWLPSAPLHVLLYRYLGWEATMPSFSHLPLILKSDGKGKLSKRDGQKQGIPVFPMAFTDENGEVYKGFREEGYYSDAVLNFLALLGWNPGTEQELFSLEELSKAFSLDRIIKGGARFDIEKANWFNENYLRARPSESFVEGIMQNGKSLGHEISGKKALLLAEMMKERVSFEKDMVTNAQYLFVRPSKYDEQVLAKKWTSDVSTPFSRFAEIISTKQEITPEEAKQILENLLAELGIPMGKIMQALRLSLTGQGGGPDLMQIISYLGGSESAARITYALKTLPFKQ